METEVLEPGTPVKATALAATKQLRSSAGRVLTACASLDAGLGTAIYYVQLLEANADGTVPADGAVTHLVTPIIVSHVNGYDDDLTFDDRIPLGGLMCLHGAWLVLSTTLATKTTGGAYMLGAGSV